MCYLHTRVDNLQLHSHMHTGMAKKKNHETRILPVHIYIIQNVRTTLTHTTLCKCIHYQSRRHNIHNLLTDNKMKSL